MSESLIDASIESFVIHINFQYDFTSRYYKINYYYNIHIQDMHGSHRTISYKIVLSGLITSSF